MDRAMNFTEAVGRAVLMMGLLPLKDKQLEALRSFVSGKDTFVALPTGYGKSVIFAVLPLVFNYMLGVTDCIVVVVTPLISLMIDQREKFSHKGIVVDFVGDAQRDEEVIQNAIGGKIQLLYISPESLINNRIFHDMLHSDVYKENLKALVVDEAHCVKMWGDEFRRAYSEIGTLRSIIPRNVNLLALTATATQETLDVVTDRLSLKEPVVIGLQPDKDNIKYLVKPCPSVGDICSALADELVIERSNMPKTVLFCRTLKHCVRIYKTIRRKLGRNITDPAGLPNLLGVQVVDLFTAASKPEMRELVLKEFCKADTSLRLTVASSAFGLGVDCPDISRIIHWGAPNTLEDLVQESGRAGRDGRLSQATLYHKIVGKKVSKPVREYGKNQIVCRRTLLFKKFLFNEKKKGLIKACNCCDICEPLCVCSRCTDQDNNS